MSLSTFDAFKHLGQADGCVEITGEKLIRLQKVLYEMLKEFDEVCQELGIGYMLGGGTCLGAVRHKGFIPWDDDLDLNMTRADFEEFEAAFEESLSDRYWLHVPGKTPGYDLCFPRLRLKGTTVRTRDDLNNSECGAYIDIFLIENAPSNGLIRALHGFVSMGLGFCYSCRRLFRHKDEYLLLAGENKAVVKTFSKKAFLGRMLSFASMDWWCHAWDAWNGIIKNNSTNYVTIPAGRKHYFGELYQRNQFFPVSFGEFSSLCAPLPSDFKSYLSTLYGENYLSLPPDEEKETHVVYEFDLGDKVDAV